MNESEFDNIISLTEGLWQSFTGKKIFLTGGTGFFGVWLTKTLVYANEKYNLKLEIDILTRDKNKFLSKYPELMSLSYIGFIEGDIRSFIFPKKEYEFIIHAATDVSLTHDSEKSIYNYDVISNGAKRIFEFAVEAKAKKVLVISSGAIYGKKAQNLDMIDEGYAGAPDILDVNETYAIAKRAMEHLAALYSQSFGFEVKIARCFAFVGPYMQLDGGLAIGNFINDYVNDNDIIVNGDGSAVRSYLYVSDLVVWLLSILIKGESCVPYNVGSEDFISIKDLAEKVANFDNKKLKVRVMKKREADVNVLKYVPNTKNAKVELGLQQTVTLSDMLYKTICWAKDK